MNKIEVGENIMLGQFWLEKTMSKLPRTIALLAAYTEGPVTGININKAGLPDTEKLDSLPAAIGMSITTYAEYAELPTYVSRVRNKYGSNPLVIVGGTYPSLFAEEAITIPGIDVVMVGYAENAWHDFTNELRNVTHLASEERRRALQKRFDGYKGIYFGANEYLPTELLACDTPLLSQSKQPNYEVLVPSVREHFAEYKHSPAIDLHYGQLGANVVIGTGCMKECRFCVIPTLAKIPGLFEEQGFAIQGRRPKDVVDEIETLVRMAEIDRLPIFLASPDALTYPQQLKAILDEVDKRSLLSHITISFDASIESMWLARTKYPDVIRAMKGRVWKVILGVESLSRETQAYIGKEFSSEDAVNALQDLAQVGAIPFVQMLIGLPPDSQDSLQNSLSQLLQVRDKVPPFALNVHRAIPFPGTALFDDVARENLLTKPLPKSDETVGEALIGTLYLTKGEVTSWITRFLSEFYTADYLKRTRDDKRPYLEKAVLREANKSGLFI